MDNVKKKWIPVGGAGTGCIAPCGHVFVAAVAGAEGH
jgi:hypothetical protein